MIVTGLNSNRFLAGNPIPVTLSLSGTSFEQGHYITMNVTKLTTHSGELPVTLPPRKLYPKLEWISIALTPYIKGLLPSPYVPYNIYQNPVPNYQNFNITLSEHQTDSSNAFLNKTFIRGFKRVDSDTGFTLSV